MSKKLFFKVLVIIGVILLSLYYALPLKKKINLGLDLQGGMHLVLQVDVSNLAPEAKKDARERALEKLRNRIDEFGVAEPLIQPQGEDQIVIQLPGMVDRQRALELVKRTGFLEFKLVDTDPVRLKDAISGNVPQNYELKYVDNNPILLEAKPVLTGEALSEAKVEFDQYGQPYVGIGFTPDGTKTFADITTQNVNRQLAIILDGKVHSAPRINEPIPSGRAQISGRFTNEDASDLAIVLRIGALPAPLEVLEERTVGPGLGKDSIKNGVTAALIGGILVVIFMAIYYLFAGFVANIALMLNILIILGGMGFFHATLTLPGIAGIILTLGMAVDANVLINERIREELKLGRPIRSALTAGYNKALSAIIDSNVTTLIAAFLLFQFGTGAIRGFAVTLTIGLIASIFTAVFVTRAIMEFLIDAKILKSLPMIQFFPKTNVDFVSKRKFFYALSAIIIILGLVSFMHRQKDIYGLDFSGGEIQEYVFDKEIPLDKIRSNLKSIGLSDASLQSVENNPKQIIIRTTTDTSEPIQAMFKKDFPDNSFQILRIEEVGPVVGKALQKKANLALIWALIGILAYVGFRFKHWDFGIAGVIALFHDVLITLGAVSLFGRQIDLLVVTAFLTIAGYSINDTIVIYDRIRELSRGSKLPLAQIINLALNQTLGRTILTSFTVIMVVLVLFFYGGSALNTFAFCLLVGFISGIYSTVYIASPLVLAWQKKAKSAK
ncbi:MAG: protein translocase subunit SecD [Candidatus Omnitrophota bacterium]